MKKKENGKNFLKKKKIIYTESAMKNSLKYLITCTRYIDNYNVEREGKKKVMGARARVIAVRPRRGSLPGNCCLGRSPSSSSADGRRARSAVPGFAPFTRNRRTHYVFVILRFCNTMVL